MATCRKLYFLLFLKELFRLPTLLAMAKYQAKTTENKNSVPDFIKTVPDEGRQKDARTLVKLMKEISGFPAKMWGPAIIGFGAYHYVYASGHEGDAPRLGFSPRKNEFALYLALPKDQRLDLLSKFGKHKSSVACIYVKKLEDIDMDILKKMIGVSVKTMKAKYG